MRCVTFAELDAVLVFERVFAIDLQSIAIDVGAVDCPMVLNGELAVVGEDGGVLLGYSGVVDRDDVC